MNSVNMIKTATGEYLLLSQYSNKIYRINDKKIRTEIKDLIDSRDSTLTNKLNQFGVVYPPKKAIDKCSFFSELEIILTYKCNLSCDYCWQRKADFNRTQMMDKTTLINAIEYIKKNNNNYSGKYNIGYMGGEPLLMFDYIKWSYGYLKENLSKILDVRILTNGTIITQEMCEFFHKNNINIIISLDGPENINKHRGSFSKVFEGIKLLTQNDIQAKIQSTLSINSFISGDAYETVQFFLNSNIYNFSLMFEGPLQIYSTNLLYDSYIKILKYVLEWTSCKKVIPLIIKEFLLSLIVPESNIPQCFCKFMYPKGFQLAPNGEIFACEFDRSKMSYGNVNQYNSLCTINSHPIAYTTTKYNHEICKNCIYAGICDGYPLLCSLYKNSKLCPKQQYFRACFDVVYPHMYSLLSILRKENL